MPAQAGIHDFMRRGPGQTEVVDARLRGHDTRCWDNLDSAAHTGKSAVVGQGGLEPPTPRLSSVCSNQLSY